MAPRPAGQRATPARPTKEPGGETMHTTVTATRSLHRGTIALVIVLVASLGLSSPPAAAATVFVGDTPELSWRVNGRVYATKVVNNTVYVGGAFTEAISPTGQVVQRRNLAAFDLATGTLRTNWRADASSTVRALASDGTWLVAGGAFAQIGGVTRSRLARVSLTTGAVDPAFAPTFNNNIRTIDVDDTFVYVGGFFTMVNGVSRSRLAKLRLQGGALDSQFNPSSDNGVWGLIKSPTSSVVYVSGEFSALNGSPRNGVGAVNSTTGATLPIVFASAARPTLGLAVSTDGARLFGAGGTGGNALAAWNTTTGVRVWRQIAMGDIQAVDYHRDTVYFGFHDGYQDDTRLKVLAADATTGLVDPAFRPRFNSYWGVFAIDVSDAGVVVGGEFTDVSGVTAQGWARFPTVGDLPPIPVTRRYLHSTSSWKYWDAGTRPSGWELAAFSDSAWPAGVPQFGYGDGDEQTVVSYGPNPSQRHITTYFRTTFEVTEVPELLTMNLVADDGAVAYLNGIEVVRDNMPVGNITNTTRAFSNRSGTDENAVRAFTVPIQHLQVGTNVLAVEVHQVSSSSSDVSFDLDLIGQWTPDPEDPPGPDEPTYTEVIGEPATWDWRYAQEAPPNDWAAATYVPVGWSAGEAPLGWGAPGPIATNIDSFSNTQDRPRAAYFRRTFDVPTGSTPVSLRLWTVADDGVIIYVNGVEVERSNMPTGPVTHMSYASSARSTAVANATTVPIDVPPGLLVEGTNVIAAEVHVNYRATPNVSFKLIANLATMPD